MIRRMRAPWTVAVFTLGMAAAIGSAQSPRPGQAPPRDTPSRPTTQTPSTPVTTARVTGRVVAADTGRPISRARVALSGPALPEGRATLTDAEGRFEVAALPGGRYTVTAGKAGFITIAFGQRRPFQPGTPLQVGDGQQVTGLELRLPRGSVITGRIVDENGEPIPGAGVRVLRYQYTQSTRQLVPVGNSQTDDRGSYRIWGLNPGEYFVSAVLPPVRLTGRGGPGAPPNLRVGRGGPTADGDSPEQVGYAPTFYPGVPSLAEARPVTVGLSAEVSGIDFGVLLVRTARIAGRVTNPDGTPVTAGMVSLVNEDGGRIAGGARGGAFGSRIDWDGSFAISAVPPGRYTLRARSDDSVEPQFANQPLAVTGDDMADLLVVLASAARISGTVVFQSTQSAVPDPGQVRVSAPFADGASFGPLPTARIDRDGRFTLDGVQAGAHLLRAMGNIRGWVLQAVLVNGRDVTDTPLDIRSGQELTGVRIVFTDRLTEVNGTVADERGSPSTDYTVLAFATDDRLWRPQSRHIAIARPDQNGRFQLRGLPPGDYFLALVDPVEQGEWFEPTFLAAQQAAATRVSLVDGDVKTQDFTVSSR
jgi:hypothetical protein